MLGFLPPERRTVRRSPVSFHHPDTGSVPGSWAFWELIFSFPFNSFMVNWSHWWSQWVAFIFMPVSEVDYYEEVKSSPAPLRSGMSCDLLWPEHRGGESVPAQSLGFQGPCVLFHALSQNPDSLIRTRRAYAAGGWENIWRGAQGPRQLAALRYMGKSSLHHCAE